MTCSLKHCRAIGDTLSLFSVQLTRNGDPANLTGARVTFLMVDDDGNEIIAETDTGVNISNPDNAYVEYDFGTADFTDALAQVAANPELTEVHYHGFFRHYIGVATEPDTYPEDIEGIEITFFNPAAVRTTPDPNIIATTDLVDLMKAPARTRTVEGTVEERSVNELIKADTYLRGKQVDGPPFGIRIAKTKPPSTLS